MKTLFTAFFLFVSASALCEAQVGLDGASVLDAVTAEHARADEGSLPLESGIQRATVKVAAVQAHSRFNDVAANHEKFLNLADEAARNGAGIVVLPEAALTGYMGDGLLKRWQIPKEVSGEGVREVDPAESALTVDSPVLREFSNLAMLSGIYLSVPFLELDRKTGRYYNTVVVFDPLGNRALHYRKHDAWVPGDGGWMTAGNLGRPVLDTPFGRIGCLICFDIHNQAEPMADLGIDILLYSIAWVDAEGSDWFDHALPDIANKQGFDIVAANWALAENEDEVSWHGHGQSRVITRSGAVLASAGGDRGDLIVYADLPVRLEEGER
ncbi:MAG: carbon-nitrogen hydrolase family protein [Verrucomicrobiales bacterium]